MIDMDKDIEVVRAEDGSVLEVEIKADDLGGDFPLLAIVGENIDDPDYQTVVRFSLEDGSSKKGKFTLRNVAEPAAASDACADCGKVELPAHLQARVIHRKYGPGKVLKVRTHDSKSSYVAFDGGEKKWVFDRKLSLAA